MFWQGWALRCGVTLLFPGFIASVTVVKCAGGEGTDIFEAVLLDESSPNSIVNGAVRSITEKEIVGRSGRDGIHYWQRPCRIQK